MQRLFPWIVLIAAALLLAGSGPLPTPAVADDGLPLVITTSSDEGAGECPSTECSLRRAIERVNEDPSDQPYTIRFSPSVFPATGLTAISLVEPLPAFTRDNVTIDGSDVVVILDGSALEGSGDGLQLAGANAVIRGLRVTGFSGACILLTGTHAVAGGDMAGQQNIVGGCGTGIAATGPGAQVTGNRIGFLADGSAGPLDVGIQVTGANAKVGDDTAAGANLIGNSQTGVLVGGSGDPFAGVHVERNTFGQDAEGGPAPVAVGVQLRQPSNATFVRHNAFMNATLAAVQVVGDSGGVAVRQNTIQANTFGNIASGLAIDLGANAVRDPNHAGPTEGGPNDRVNHPTFTRATQAGIIGSSAGCPGCLIEVYVAAHVPGRDLDYGATLMAGGRVTADPTGQFFIPSPPIAAGQWIVATVTDTLGNTSEFGPSTRVGAGVIQCGNLSLNAGWAHVAFFGPESVTLGDTFPGDPGYVVRAAYRLAPGEEWEFDHWFRDTTLSRTLPALEPGETYWLQLDGPLTLPYGFSLTSPLPVALQAGWNEFTYLGASADVRDALATIAGKYEAVFVYSGEGWKVAGPSTAPPYAREFDQLQACGSYSILMTEATVLTPLQP